MSATTTYTISFTLGGNINQDVRLLYKGNNEVSYTVLTTLLNLAPNVTHTYTLPPLESHRMYTLYTETLCEGGGTQVGTIRYLCNFICNEFTLQFAGSTLVVDWDCWVDEGTGDSVKEYRIDYREVGSLSPYTSVTVPMSTILTFWNANPGSYPSYTEIIPGINPAASYEVNFYTIIEYNFYDVPLGPVLTDVIINNDIPCTLTINAEICAVCSTAIDFVSNPSVNGLYVDDNSEFVYVRSGGVFNTILEEEALVTGWAAGTTSSVFASRTIATPNKVFRANNIGGAGGNSEVFVFDGGAAPVLLTSFSTTAGTVIRAMAYNPNDGLIYFSNTYNSNVLNTLDPNTYAINYGIINTFAPPACTTIDEIFINETTNEAWIICNNSSAIGTTNKIVVVSLTGTPTISAYIDNVSLGDVTNNPDGWFGNDYGPKGIVFDNSGQAWIGMNNGIGVGYDVIVVDATTYGLVQFIISASAYEPQFAGPNGTQFFITYYPGDGTPNSDRVFVQYGNGVGTDYEIYEYITSAPYTETLFFNNGGTGFAQPTLYYSPLFNKLLQLGTGVLTIYNPQNSLDTYGAPVFSITRPSRPYELVAYNQVIFSNYEIADNILYAGLDENNIQFCSEGLVDMYLTVGPNENGPYRWDSTTSSWDPLCSYSVANNTPSPGEFTVTATLDAFVTDGVLEISTDGGIIWTPYADQLSILYAASATWALGRVYTSPGVTFIVRILFTTNDGCGLYSQEITI